MIARETRRILVVNDTESNRYVLSTWLRRAGYDVLEATTGTEALEIIGRRRVDLVVLDVYLPDISGYAVCERIKEGSTANIPVLHVSSVATQSADRSEGLRRGAEGFLAEPIEREELLATVEALLRAADAQRIAGRLARFLRHLNDATLAVNDAVGLDRLVLEIALQASTLFDARAVVAVAVEDTALLGVAAGVSETRLQECPSQTVDALCCIAEGVTRVSAAVVSEHAPIAADEGSFLCSPLTMGSSHRGVLLVEPGDNADASAPETLTVLTQFVRAANIALRNMRSYDIERGIALMLQKSLLPQAPSRFVGLDIATRYAASAAHSEVGGDFYEIFHVDGNRIAIAIGDVVGHSLEAATIMAQLRTGIRCYALEGHSPGAIVERLNRLLFKFHPEVTATACVALYEIDTGVCRLANAGHLPPLVVGKDGASFLPLGGALLGVEAEARPPYEFTLMPDDTLLLYTDGLVERPGEPLDVGMERLARAASRGNASLDALCDDVMREGPARLIDDIAIVAIRRTVETVSPRVESVSSLS